LLAELAAEMAAPVLVVVAELVVIAHQLALLAVDHQPNLFWL
jgi:hypothetical protein